MKCAACAKDVEAAEGIELWGSRFCTKCFIGRSQDLNRKLTEEELGLLRLMGRDLAGLIPPDLVEMIMVGFAKRSGVTPEKPETERCIAELQRLTAFACNTQILNLLQKWQEVFSAFVREQEDEIREKMKRLSEGL